MANTLSQWAQWLGTATAAAVTSHGYKVEKTLYSFAAGIDPSEAVEGAITVALQRWAATAETWPTPRSPSAPNIKCGPQHLGVFTVRYAACLPTTKPTGRPIDASDHNRFLDMIDLAAAVWSDLSAQEPVVRASLGHLRIQDGRPDPTAANTGGFRFDAYVGWA